MKNFFKELFEYNHHFNQKLAKGMIENSNQVSEKSTKLFNHILNAHHVWNSRIIELKPFGVWEIHGSEIYQEIDKNNYENTLLVLDKFDLSDKISYTNTKGQSFTNNIRDILFHVINHSTYHRAQIASDFKQSELTPLVTDYIFYKR